MILFDIDRLSHIIHPDAVAWDHDICGLELPWNPIPRVYPWTNPLDGSLGYICFGEFNACELTFKFFKNPSRWILSKSNYTL